MPARLDVYLMPAVVGGGLGDIDEVLVAGAYLHRAGFSITLYRRDGRDLPRSVDGPWDWPPHRRTQRLVPRAPRALTVTPCWGVSAAPSRDEPFGRGGPWEVEATEIERRYGATATLHVSLEEFARTGTSRTESIERWREGGLRQSEIRRRTRGAGFRAERTTFHDAYRRFRGFDRGNVLHLYATFAPSRAFAREFPEAVQCGPLWPLPRRRPTLRRARPAARRWVWYASPSSAERLAPAVLRGLAHTAQRPFVEIRSPRPWSFAVPAAQGRLTTTPEPPATWRRDFDGAEVRVVTGSRTLLEAIRRGGPFLYFNGVLGSGSATHRHRPEKLARLLEVARFPRDVRRDLADFARGRRVEAVTERVAERRGGWRTPSRGPWVRGFAPSFEDTGRLVVATARRFARGTRSSSEVVAELRSGRPPVPD